MGTMTRRVCAAVWLPLSLAALAVILRGVLDEALLAILLVLVALAATGLLDLLRTMRANRRGPRP
ncbi:hypothetical protein ACVW00_001635 [Marmoricola sp. URHA0025 HA25]